MVVRVIKMRCLDWAGKSMPQGSTFRVLRTWASLELQALTDLSYLIGWIC
jgi:hypothetical protein